MDQYRRRLNGLAAYRLTGYSAAMKAPHVKINLELGAALRQRLENDAAESCRKLSWQVLFYLQTALTHHDLIVDPRQSLDDNGGRFTAYVPEPVFDDLVRIADKRNANLSAVVRAAILQGMQMAGGQSNDGQ